MTDTPPTDRAAVLAEVAEALTARHCSPESVATARLLVTHRLCTDCKGYGQTVTDTPDGGIVRRCRACDGAGLRRLADEPQQLCEATPALSTDRTWQIQFQRRNGSWVDHSPATIHGSEAQAEYEQTVASTGHLWSYRLVCSDRTHTIAAQHNRPEEAGRG